jgi:predicted nucleic acid binding AN1-type Zn finger protein
MNLENIDTSSNNQKNLLHNLNDFFIQIDYFDQKGIKKHKNKVPLKYILNSKIINTKIKN